MQRDGAELRASRFRRQAGAKLPFSLVEDLAGDVDGGRQPMGEGKLREQRERPVRRAQPLFAPGDIREAEVMAPVVGFESDGAPGGSQRVDTSAGPSEDESKRRPALRGAGVETARFAGVVNRLHQRTRIR